MMTAGEYLALQDRVSKALEENMKGELEGKYYSLEDMDEDRRKELVDSHYLFKEGDRFLQAANACRDWPMGRGIFFNSNKTFLVWCGEEDHLRIISMQKVTEIIRACLNTSKMHQWVLFSTGWRCRCSLRKIGSSC